MMNSCESYRMRTFGKKTTYAKSLIAWLMMSRFLMVPSALPLNIFIATLKKDRPVNYHSFSLYSIVASYHSIFYRGYPLEAKIAIENDPFVVDLPIKDGDFP